VSQTSAQAERSLLTTVTGEPLQPVRLYFSIPTRAAVTRTLLGLRCVAEDEGGRRFAWLYQNEAVALTFGGSRTHADLPAEVHPVVLGEFRFPEKDRMVLALRSFNRAIEAAKFFGPILDDKATPVRVRVINRWLDAAEGLAGPEPLDRLLDQNVTRVDPQAAEDAFDRAMAGAHTREEKERAFAAYAEERRRRDVPLVEDFPLHPEEETPDFRDLAMILRLRTMRAYEHWRGNTHVTLADVIHRLVEEHELGAEEQ
jgi:hypothetical protein